MEALGYRSLSGGLAILLACLIPCRAAEESPRPLLSPGAAAQLDRQFPSQDISYLLTNMEGTIVAERWTEAQLPISPGSLVKPFLAIAYGEQHDGVFPRARCMGTRDRCWLPQGHGTLSLEEAIAQSCNAYFLQLATDLDRVRAAQTIARYGLAGPPETSSSETLMGLGDDWKETPLALARAYLRIEREQRQPIQGRLIKGMQMAARRGTARAVDASLGENDAWAKTGTAMCSHFPHGAGDGFTVVFYPVGQPRLFLLVRVHGVVGAQSAKVAAEMLRSLGAGKQ